MKSILSLCCNETVHDICLSVEIVSLDVGSDLSLPLVSIVEEFLFVIKQLLMGLCGELKVGTLRKRQEKVDINSSKSGHIECIHPYGDFNLTLKHLPILYI